MIERLEDQVGSLRENQQAAEKALKQQYSLVEVLTLERNEVTLALEQTEDEKASLRDALTKASHATDELQVKLQQSSRKQDQVVDRMQKLHEHNAELLETNAKLRALVERSRRKSHDFQEQVQDDAGTLSQ